LALHVMSTIWSIVYVPWFPENVTLGGVSSTLSPVTEVCEWLSAASRAVPVTDWCAPSPRRAAGEQNAIPDSASAHENETRTSALYQPAAFGPRSGPPVIVGGVRSRETSTESLAVLPALSRAVPLTGIALPSSVSSCAGEQKA